MLTHTGLRKGKIFGLSFWGPDSYVLVINQDHFIEAGLDPQGADLATWDGLSAATERLSKKDSSGIYNRLGYPYDVPGFEAFASWLYANGGDMHNEELSEAVFDSPKALELADHRQKQFIRYRDRGDDYPSGRAALQEGRGSAVPWGTWAAYYIRDEFEEGLQLLVCAATPRSQQSGRGQRHQLDQHDCRARRLGAA